MSKLLKIGNKKIGEHIKDFFFDGCHKIYLIEDEEDKQDFLKNKNYLDEDNLSNDDNWHTILGWTIDNFQNKRG